MAPEVSASLSWHSRARLLAVDLFAFDIRRLNWGLAVRAMVGLVLPLLLSLALRVPELVWMGVGAFLLAVGDCVDDGDRQQSLRLVLGTVLGSIAIATGVLAGSSLGFAVAGMLFWGFLTATPSAFGSGFAAMSLPIAWAYVELGLPANDHSLRNALLLGILFALGGLLILTLTFLIRFRGPYAEVKSASEPATTPWQATRTEGRQRGRSRPRRRCAAPSQKLAAWPPRSAPPSRRLVRSTGVQSC